MVNTKSISLRIDPELLGWAKKEAHRREQTFSAMVRDVLGAQKAREEKGVAGTAGRKGVKRGSVRVMVNHGHRR